MKDFSYRLGFIGFGHMAQIIFQAIAQARLIPRSQVLFHQRDPDKIKKNEMHYRITSTSLKNLVDKSDILILAVRPNQAAQVMKALKDLKINEPKILMSVIAGLNLNFYEKYWSQELVRVMPNVASGVGEGLTTLVYKPGSSSLLKEISRFLFLAMGKVVEVKEDLMDIASAVAGSGPGFVFRLIEAFSKTGMKHGLKEEDAKTLAAQTFFGAAKMILKGGEPETLLTQIATPNGVTEAGLKEMQAKQIPKHIESVIETSMKRSIQLSEEFSQNP